MKDKWMNIGCEEEELKPYTEPEPELNDPRRMDVLTSMGLTRDEIEESLRNKKYDDIMANYLLLDPNQNDAADSRSSSSLSLRGLRPALEAATNNGQSPLHGKVQRSVSATAKPRRFSHGGDPPPPGAAVGAAGTTAGPPVTLTSAAYKRQNTLDANLVKERPENSNNSPPSPSSASSGTRLVAKTPSNENPPLAPILNTTKITGISSLRASSKTGPSPITIKNTFSGIPRRNTYNTEANKTAADKLTIPELPAGSVILFTDSLTMTCVCLSSP
jgi:MAP/microtubule affinity-regulating kinase